MNIHHLELFYYVARHGGIMPAVRNIPYGIQQPAISAQVGQLEEYLGVTLFHRRPFQLTDAGEKLFAHIQPFFSKLDALAAEFQGGQARYIRIGASTIVLRDHVPRLLQGVRKKFPGLKVSLREGFPAHLQGLLDHDEVDLVITLIDRKNPPGLQSMTLLELPMVLLVGKQHDMKSAQELWERDRIEDTLICLPPTEMLSRNFFSQLQELDVDWYPGIEASSTDLIETYVSKGLGIGLSVAIPQKPLPAGVRALPLPGFAPVTIGVLWRQQLTPLLQAFIAEAQSRARELA
jgi:DNA-binding transcriptional LysR family regulator